MHRVSRKPKLLVPLQVALLFGVDPKTTARWADEGKIETIRTLGGHRRFSPDEVRRLLNKNYEGTILAERLAQLNEMLAS